jgi:hypothetical protein
LSHEDSSGVRTVRLAGTHVAFDNASCSSTLCNGDIRSLDVRTGKLRRAYMRTGTGYAIDIEVTTTGAIAWTRSATTYGPREPEIRKLDAGGEAVVDRGADIDLSSLAVAGSRLYWTRADAPRSARLE